MLTMKMRLALLEWWEASGDATEADFIAVVECAANGDDAGVAVLAKDLSRVSRIFSAWFRSEIRGDAEEDDGE
jgi:hypothetical protein